LKGKEWLVSARLTIADLAFAPSLAYAPMLGFDLGGVPHVTAWLERLKERPAFKKVFG
jgi:glutathione S-transferase